MPEGIEFVPIDIYTAKAQRFQIVDRKTDASTGHH